MSYLKQYNKSFVIFQPTQQFSANDTAQFEPHPHMCYRNSTGGMICEVYTEYSKLIEFTIGLKPTINDNDTDEICKYPFGMLFIILCISFLCIRFP